MRAWGLIVAACLLAACSSGQVPMVQLPTTAPSVAPPGVTAPAKPAVKVLAVKVAKPAKVAPKPKPKVVKTHIKAPKVRSMTHAKPRKVTKASTVCYVNKPCDLSHLTWTKTVGCTVAWRKATGKPCPPGWPAIP